MPLSYSDDLRKRIINALEKGNSVKEVVLIFDVKKSAIYNWIKRYKETGNYGPVQRNSGRKSNITSEQMELIRTKILEQPDITLTELKEQLKLPICISALCRIINNKLKLNYKKNSSCKRAE